MKVTMDGSVARIVQFSDSDDDEPKLKPRPAPELPPKNPQKDQTQQGPVHRNVLGEFWSARAAGQSTARQAVLHATQAPLLLTEGKRMAEGFSGMGRWARGVRHAPLQLSTGQRGIRRVQNLWHEQAVPQLRQAYSGITLSFVIKVRRRPMRPTTGDLGDSVSLRSVTWQCTCKRVVRLHCSWRCFGCFGGVPPRRCHSWSSPVWRFRCQRRWHAGRCCCLHLLAHKCFGQ